MGKLGFQMFVCIAVVLGVWFSPLGRKIDAWWYYQQHKDDPKTAQNAPQPGYAGDQSSVSCTPLPDYRTCGTVEVSNITLGEGVNNEAHLAFSWNNVGNEANAVGQAWVTLSTSNGGSMTVQVLSGDNLLQPFDPAYVPASVSANGFECVMRDGKTFDCR